MPAEPHLPRVLLIDDQELAAELVRHVWHDQPDISFQHVPEPEKALEAAIVYGPTVVLVDLKMPTIDGIEVIRRFRAREECRLVPMILLSSEDDAETKVKAFAAGANDYLVKWPDKRELVARVRYHSSAYTAHKQRDDAFLSLRKSQEELLVRTRELAASQAALHHAQKMEAIGQLTGGVAHDFNNLLQVISGNLQLLKLITAGNESAQKRIAAAIEGIERGAKLSNHLLAFARRQPLQPLILDVGSLLRNMAELLHRSLGSRTTIETVIDDGLWNTLADPSQLENVILNLAINARDAMGGGKLTIHAMNATGSPSDDGEYVLIEVRDTGVGMPPEVLERAFEPFFTTKPAGQGTGLGLSMAYGFVRQSGGHIKIESSPGSGTSVRVYLPRDIGEAEAIAEVAAGPIFGGVETILVVEDEPGVRATTVELLSSLGYLTLQAPDAASALRILETDATIDLMFTDVVMPGTLRTTELAERAKILRPAMQILFTSGYSEGELGNDGRLDPSISLLRKPYSAETLAQKIRHLLRRRAASTTPVQAPE